MDLNVIVENCGSRDSIQVIKQKVLRCKELGYSTIALSVIIEVKNNSPEVPSPPELKDFNTGKLKVLTRLTARVGDNIHIYKINKSKETAKYDLLAFEPQNAKILQYISMGSAELDILTFNLSERLDYSLFKTQYKVLEEQGVCVEINYGPAQLSSSLRRNIICNAQNLTEKTTKNILLSSGVEDVFRLRAPKDAQAIGVLFLLPLNKCHGAVFDNGLKALRSAQNRKNPTSSAIELISVE